MEPLQSRVEPALLDPCQSTEWNEVALSRREAFDLSEWHRLTYQVDGTALKVWFDGTKLFEKEMPFANDVVSNLGFWSQGCKLELRKLRFGTLP